MAAYSTTNVLHWADYVVFVIFLVISLVIGVYHAFSGGRQRTTSEFLVANRQLAVLPTMLSMMMSFLSAIMILGTTAEMYLYGAEYAIGVSLAYPIALLVIERVVVPWLFPLQLTSSFEFLERRFQSKAARATGSFFGIISSIFYIGVAMFAPSIALEAVTGIDIMISVFVMSMIATIYTAVGGMRAVIYTDVFQGVVFFIGTFGILVRGWIIVGPQNAYSIAKEAGRLQVSMSFDPTIRHTMWGLIFGFASTIIYLYGFNQASVQRYSATKSLRDARLVMLAGIPFVVALNVINGISGITMFAYFTQSRCDPLTNGDIYSANQVLPFFVSLAFSSYKGFLGLSLAMLYSGALSSVSSSLSGCAANIWEDILKPKLRHRLSEHRAAVLNKVLVVIVGVVGMSMGMICTVLPGTLVQIAIALFGACGGPIVGMYLLGGISKAANWIGAVAAGWSSFAFIMWLNIGSLSTRSRARVLTPPPTDHCFTNASIIQGDLNNTTYESSFVPLAGGIGSFYQLSYLWYTIITITVAVIVGMLVSHLARYLQPSLKDVEVDEDCLIRWKTVFSLTLDGPDSKADKKFQMAFRDRYDGGQVTKKGEGWETITQLLTLNTNDAV